MPKARPVSLHPLTFDEAVKALINVDPEKVGRISKHRKRRGSKIQRQTKTKQSKAS